MTPYPHAQRAGNVSTPLSFSYEKESAVDGRKKEYQREICVGTNYTSLILPQAAGFVRFVVPPFPARIASLDSRGSPIFGIPLKRPRRGLMPPSWIIPGVWFVRKYIQAIKKRDNDAYWTDRRGSRNTLRLFRLPYVKYSTGTNMGTIKNQNTNQRSVCVLERTSNAMDELSRLRGSEGYGVCEDAARRAFLDHQCNDNT